MNGGALPDPRSGPGKDAAAVQRMFDRVARGYDVTNTVLSLGQDRFWRRVAVKAAHPVQGEVALDVAAGTGMLAHELRRSGATVVALDLSRNMLGFGAERERSGRVPGKGAAGLLWCNGDAVRLPLADGSVDVVTIAFGLRNLGDPRAGLAEFARVTRPGGRLVVLEFSSPPNALLRWFYQRVALGAVPLLARASSSDPPAYTYLADSIRAWPRQDELAGMMTAAGWRDARWRNLTGGVVACHRALRA
jgi:demethylmenaquinone methyltransferase/2-methoxy-6-polyprenyl-1,4-benzoquinol methylase